TRDLETANWDGVAAGFLVGPWFRLSDSIEIHGAGAKLIATGGQVLEAGGPPRDAVAQGPVLGLAAGTVEAPDFARGNPLGRPRGRMQGGGVEVRRVPLGRLPCGIVVVERPVQTGIGPQPGFDPLQP